MKSPYSFARWSLPLLLLVLFSAFSVANAQDEYAAVKTWETYDFAARAITTADLSALSIDDLKLVRGIVFGKHGRVFKDPDIKRFLESRPWFNTSCSPVCNELNWPSSGRGFRARKAPLP